MNTTAAGRQIAIRMTPDELADLTRRPEAGPHHATVVIDGTPVQTLEDLPPLRDRLLFVGLNPSPVSVAAGHYFQGRLGRTFWRRLVTAALLPPPAPVMDPAHDALMPAPQGVPNPHRRPRSRDDASDATLRAGVGPLWHK